MAKPIVVQVTKATDDYIKGAEFGFDTEAKAASTLGDGNFKIVRYQDQSPYEAPVQSSTPKRNRRSGANTQAAAPQEAPAARESNDAEKKGN